MEAAEAGDAAANVPQEPPPPPRRFVGRRAADAAAASAPPADGAAQAPAVLPRRVVHQQVRGSKRPAA
jgi:hypothetical protein